MIVVDDGSTDSSKERPARVRGESRGGAQGERRPRLSLQRRHRPLPGRRRHLPRCRRLCWLPRRRPAPPRAFAADENIVKVQSRMEVVDAEGRSTGLVKPPPHMPMPNGDVRREELSSTLRPSLDADQRQLLPTEAIRRIMPIPEGSTAMCAELLPGPPGRAAGTGRLARRGRRLLPGAWSQRLRIAQPTAQPRPPAATILRRAIDGGGPAASGRGDRSRSPGGDPLHRRPRQPADLAAAGAGRAPGRRGQPALAAQGGIEGDRPADQRLAVDEGNVRRLVRRDGRRTAASRPAPGDGLPLSRAPPGAQSPARAIPAGAPPMKIPARGLDGSPGGRPGSDPEAPTRPAARPARAKRSHCGRLLRRPAGTGGGSRGADALAGHRCRVRRPSALGLGAATLAGAGGAGGDLGGEAVALAGCLSHRGCPTGSRPHRRRRAVRRGRGRGGLDVGAAFPAGRAGGSHRARGLPGPGEQLAGTAPSRTARAAPSCPRLAPVGPISAGRLGARRPDPGLQRERCGGDRGALAADRGADSSEPLWPGPADPCRSGKCGAKYGALRRHLHPPAQPRCRALAGK